MTFRPIGLALVSSLVLASTVGVAQSAPRAFVAPVHGATCRDHEPVLLGAGSEPRSPLRIDLDSVANRTEHSLETERVYTKSRAGSTGWRSSHGTVNTKIDYRTAAPVNGHLPVDVQMRDPKASAEDAAQLDRVHLVGFFDALNGGSLTTKVEGGSATSRAQLRKAFSGNDGPVSDHLPAQAIGIGASWRVVRCDVIQGAPAKVSRVYTLRSLRNGVVVASFRETIGPDPSHENLGETKIGTETVGVRMLSLHGSSTGSMRLPLADALAEQDSTLTRMSVVMRFVREHAADIKVETNLVLQRSFK
jgi:hypothetical protein